MPLSLILAFGIVSAFTTLKAQTASSVEKAKVVSFPVENDLVNRYLQHADNAYGDGIGRFGISVLCYWLLEPGESPYLHEVPESGGLPKWAEQCAPIKIPANKGNSVLISTTPSFEKYLSVSSESDTALIYNLVPQTVYWYRVLSTENKVLSDGIFKTQSRLRMIKTEKVINVRDIGGWKCDGGRLAYGKIYRGGTLQGVTNKIGPVGEADIVELVNNIGISSEFDLRQGVGLSSSPLGKDVIFHNIAVTEYMGLMRNIKSSGYENSGTYYSDLAKLMNTLIADLKAGKSAYVHCLMGADRTGTIIALIEALCGVSEADIVKDWELTSFSAVGYRKYINVQAEYKYKNSNGETVKAPDEMRAVFEYLYDNYGGADGASLKQQVTRWFEDKIFPGLSDKGASIINELRSLLITPDVQSPVIIKDLSKEIGTYQYSVTKESTAYYNSQDSKYIVPSTGKTDADDAFSCTDYIACSGYSYLLLNAPTAQIGAFYDANKKYIGSIVDSTVSSNFGSGTVLFDHRQYSIPAKAAYVKLNMPKYCDWTAVLTVNPYL
ncbi:MAG: tyrosine-protein phosphatase [Paludibacteraceae bacterium]|nr:tyrosine-protein phosphatase [Paludibacteraceae bacterium]